MTEGRRSRRSAWRAFAVAGAVGALLTSSLHFATAAPKEVIQSEPLPIKVDRDGDKVFDDLEARLAQMSEGDTLSVIVRLRSSVSSERIPQLKEEVGPFDVTHRLNIVNGFAANVRAGQVRALAGLEVVAHVEENSVVRSQNASAQDSFGVTAARNQATGLDGNGDGSASLYSAGDLVAAVIDTGIDPNHVDLDEGKVIGWKDYVNNQAQPYDDHGHGTHVAGTIAGDGEGGANGKGVAPGAALVGVKVLDRNGSGTMANVTAGIQWVVENKTLYGVEAINLSLGTSGCSDGTDSTSAAVNAAHDAGIVVAVAAGNSGPGTCTIGSPGAAAKAVTAGAMADLGVNGFKQAYFSSRGKTADGRIKPDISGPGVSVTSADANTGSGYVTYSGTSMATPFVAGVSLLMRGANSSLTSQQVKDKIMNTAVDWARGGDNKTAGSSGDDIDYGAGRLDGYAALESAGAAMSGSAPLMPAHQLEEGTLPGTGAVVDYDLNITDTQFPIAGTLIHNYSGGSASTPDFDLYLYDPAGTEVAKAITTRRQDELGYKPTAIGTYKLRVKSYSGSGGYFVDISAATGPDTAAPTVNSVSPSDGATGVSVNTNVGVTFSEPMDKDATETAFSFVKSSDSSPVSGAFSWSGNAMTFDPSADLEKRSEYTATVTTAARDTAGNALSANEVWSFTITTLSTVTAFPTSTTIQAGTPRSGSAPSLDADDNAYFEVNSTTSGTRTTAWYGTFTGVSNDLANLTVTYKGKNSKSCSQTVAIWRWTDSTWVQLDSRSVNSTEVGISVAPGGTLADYVSGTSGDGDLRVRVSCTRKGATFYASGDLLAIVYDEA